MEDYTPVVIKPNSHFSTKVLIISSVISLLLGLLVGSGIFFFREKVSLQKLPASIELLKSPAVTNWSAHVEGYLIDKNPKTFTLERENSRITIEINSNITAFFGEATPAAKVRPLVSIDNIPLKTYLQGEVTIHPQYRGGYDGKLGKQHITANVFEIAKSPPR